MVICMVKKSVACVGRLLKDHKLPDGRHFIRLHGVCRAEIRHVEEPEGDRLFRRAYLKPVSQPVTGIPKSCRSRLHDLLTGERLVRMRLARVVPNLGHQWSAAMPGRPVCAIHDTPASQPGRQQAASQPAASQPPAVAAA